MNFGAEFYKLTDYYCDVYSLFIHINQFATYRYKVQENEIFTAPTGGKENHTGNLQSTKVNFRNVISNYFDLHRNLAFGGVREDAK